ncbi:hypothetical protein GUITHDRAFT_101069 [Guillardia theta CCMP2712]|uniref:Uncharacterized protein n=1 Tax=Guillardia theta (strain CCMP2712) TaxID=905079 RepID=L1JYU0_GUITC|nr:hypothetical protein GUITHDRAFT_101069 [Guillardia theta CCMP2712]EKX53365.1 hypothetical protein GUITHDRAFT_101069 [Guillardia theta CCMP2712]|eukprot:XP_005840345.1 hypothetical protein GUITHDRAFT_101069 [Guillardia theta CCMP2712]
MKNGFLVERRRQAMQKRGMQEATKEQIQEMPWSTGLFDIWTDPETLYVAGHGAWGGLPAATSAAPRHEHFVSTPVAFCCMNNYTSMAYPPSEPGRRFPFIRVTWRKHARTRFLVKGSCLGDCLAVTLCYFCSALQEAREVRIESDDIFNAIKRIDGSTLPTTTLANYEYSEIQPMEALSMTQTSLIDQ